MSKVLVPKIELNSRHYMPQIGYGTWLAKPGEVGEAVKKAIKCGYRHIDCAFIYGNQREIGAALREVMREGIVERSDLFITSKIWNTFHSKEAAKQNVDTILEELDLDYLDLCLIHWPMGYQEGGELFPKDPESGKILLSDAHFFDTWQALEDAVFKEKINSIGLSNFNAEQVKTIDQNCRIRPAALQIEVHPYCQQKELVEYCREKGIRVIAFSPLGSSSANPFRKPDFPTIQNDPVITRIAANHEKTNAQVVLRYHVQRGVCPIPKSMNEERMAENLRVFDFILSHEEMTQIGWLDRDKRILHLELSCHSPLYPWVV